MIDVIKDNRKLLYLAAVLIIVGVCERVFNVDILSDFATLLLTMIVMYDDLRDRITGIENDLYE